MIERAFERVPAERLYAATGIQTMPINTVFQLLADEGSAALEAAQRIALYPTCSRCGCAASSPTSARTPPPPGCSTPAAASGRAS